MSPPERKSSFRRGSEFDLFGHFIFVQVNPRRMEYDFLVVACERYDHGAPNVVGYVMLRAYAAVLVV